MYIVMYTLAHCQASAGTNRTRRWSTPTSPLVRNSGTSAAWAYVINYVIRQFMTLAESPTAILAFPLFSNKSQ